MTILDIALVCAAMLMGQAVPVSQIMWLKQSPPVETCMRAGRATAKCSAATASAGRIWIVTAPADMSFDVMVHEACHRVQFIREGGYTPRSQGPMAERECDRVQARSKECRR